MNYQELHKMLTACLTIAPKRDVRYYLNGIHVISNEYGTTIEAADGSCLVQFKTTDIIQGSREGIDVILDRAHAKLFADKIKAMGYNKTDSHDVIITGQDEGKDISFDIETVKIIDGRYPDCERVIWKDAPKPITEIGFDARFLANIVKVTKPFTSKPCQPVRMEFKGALDSMRVKFDTGIDGLEVVFILMPCRL